MCVQYIDLEGSVLPREMGKVILILTKLGVYWKRRRLVKDPYLDQTVGVRIGEEITEEIGLRTRVRQGCCPSSALISVYIEEIIKECFDEKRGVWLERRMIKCLDLLITW